MRHADAELQLWLANDRITRDHHEMEMAHLARAGSGTATLRQRAGQAVIALGQRLAGDRRHAGEAPRLMTRAL